MRINVIVRVLFIVLIVHILLLVRYSFIGHGIYHMYTMTN